MRQLIFYFSLLVMVGIGVRSVVAQGNTPSVFQKIASETATHSVWAIPYTKYRLSNGLTVIVHEDHSDPMVHVEVMYHVGSAREEIGKSGFAHLFEHMMFQGSKHVPYNAHFKLITEAGGKMNGSAARDRTNYYQTVPRNQLDTVLWLESDRMGYFLDGINQEKFEIQRATVKNEKAQRYDNRPYGRSGEYLYKIHYPTGHPYSWETIGNVPDLDRVTADDLKAFFKRWYGPNNAVIVIAGDVNTELVIEKVARYFGPIPAGPDVPRPADWVPTLTENRYISYEDPLVELPQLTLVFPTPPSRHPDEPALDCLAMILGAGPNARLYQALVKSKQALSVEAYNYTSELAGEFVITVTPYAGTPLSKILDSVSRVLESVATESATSSDIQRFRSSYEVGVMQRLQSVEETAGILVANELYTGNAGYLKTESKRYLGVTSEDVQSVYHRYIHRRPMSVLSVLPPGQGELRAAPDSRLTTSDGLSPVAVTDTLDRTQRPTPDVAPVPAVLPIWNLTTGNCRIAGITDKSNDLVKIQVRFGGGSVLAKQLGYPDGSASFLADMMMQDSKSMTVEALNAELETLGSSISIGASDMHLQLSIQSLRPHLAETLALVHHRLRDAAFTESDFDRLRTQALESIKSSRTDADRIADIAVARLMYGYTHPLATIGLNSTSIRDLTIDRLKTLYNDLFAGGAVEISVVGNVDGPELDALVDLVQFPPSAHRVNVALNVVPSAAAHIVLVNLPGAVQSEVRIAAPGMAYDVTGNFYVSQLFNFPVGGNFNSRLNMQLREVRGISYGAYSYLQGSEFPGYFEAGASVKGAATGLAVRDALDILSGVAQSGITAADVDYMKNAVLQREALRYETGDQKLDLLSRIQRFKLPADFLIQRADRVKTITREDLNLVGQALFQQPFTIVIVGDATQVRPQIETLGIPVIETTVDEFIW